MHFGGGKDHVDTLGLVFCLVLQVLQDEELAEEHHSLSGTNSVVLLHVGL